MKTTLFKILGFFIFVFLAFLKEAFVYLGARQWTRGVSGGPVMGVVTNLVCSEAEP